MTIYKNLILAFCIIMATATTASAGTLCVNSAATLQQALTFAASNSQADEIRIVKGTYIGSFEYLGGRDEDLTIVGGYNIGCTIQTLNPLLSVLDANHVTLSTLSIAGNEAVIKIKSLSVRNAHGPGIYVINYGVDKDRSQVIFDQIWSHDNGQGLVAYGDNITANRCRVYNTLNAFKAIEFLADYEGSSSRQGNLIVSNSSITGNVAPDAGIPLVALKGSGSVSFINNKFQNNKSKYGAGVDIAQSYKQTVRGNVFSSNRTFVVLHLDPNAPAGYLQKLPYVSTYVDHNQFFNNLYDISDFFSGNTRLIDIDAKSINSFDAPENIVIANNIIANNDYRTSTTGSIIYLYHQGIANIANNTVTANKGFLNAGIYLKQATNDTKTMIYNNILWGNKVDPLHAPRGDLYIQNDANNDGIASSVVLKNNDINKVKAAKPLGKQSGNVRVNPLFVNTTTGDFHLQPTSPLINKGINTWSATLPYYATDIDRQTRLIGTAIDIGADEFKP